MSFDWATWGPPLVVLLGGLVVGLLVALRIQGGSVQDHQEQEDALNAAKDGVLDSLRELEAHRERLSPQEYEDRRAALLAEGAAFLQALDEPSVEQSAEEPSPDSSEKRYEAWAWMLGSLGFVVLAILLVRGAEVPRIGDGPMTGGSNIAGSSAATGMGSVIEQRIAAATTALEANPHDVEALNTLIHFSLIQGDMQGAMQRFMQALTVAPNDSDVIAHGAALAILVNLGDRAIPALETLLEDDPDHVRGHWWMAVGQARAGDESRAREHLVRLQELAPGTEFVMLAQDLLQSLDQPPPVVRVGGNVALGEGVRLPDTGTLFVAALSSQGGGGPPVAAGKYPNAQLPAEFSLGDTDLTFGGQWPDQVWLRARVDVDGDPMTRGEGDLESLVVGPITSGTEDIQLVLETMGSQ
ncbi:MAG: hypothetical protein VX519_12780 [Myxococcota bacterium]|nr:hypothetical protein [Myxococcota bacterium]